MIDHDLAVRSSSAVNLMKFMVLFGFGDADRHFIGGTERQVLNLGLALEPSRFAIHFGCLRRMDPVVEDIDARGIPVFDYRVSTFRHPRVFAAQLRLARDIRRHHIRIVHTYNFDANLFAIPAAKLAGARVIASIRDMGIYLSPAKRRLQRYVCRLADRILVNAGAIRDWLVADGYEASRITVIPNGIDLARFDYPPARGRLHREFGFPPDTPLIGVVGRVKPLKGIEDFLVAASKIAPRFPEARFLIVGDGHTSLGKTIARDCRYQEELTSLAAQLGVRDRVVFTGFRSDVEQLFTELSVSVLPSHSEGLSNSLLESMAGGAPVVATSVGGTAEAVRDGENGLLVPPGDPEALAASVCRLLEAPDSAARLGQAARRSIAERFSVNRLVEATSVVYDSLLEGGSPAPLPTPECPVSTPRSS